MTDITQTPYWQSLSEDAARMAGTRMTSLFEADSGRSSRYRIESGPIMLDYSKNLLDDTTLANLGKLFEASGLNARREAMFRGEQVNNTEERAALHTLLRARPDDLDPENSANFTAVTSTLRQMERISSAVRSGEWKGASGKPVRTVIHLGIGGSYLGPHMVDEALSPYRDSNSPECHYVANVDGIHIDQVLRQCDPASTLIIVVSKSFTTLETRLNANAARSWLLNAIDEGDLHHHLVGVTSNIEAALTYGIAEENLLPMWDWVGGRYSVWSAVGLPLAIRYGFEAFSELLSGARAMDQHFRTAAFPDNLPMMLAGIGVFYHNFMDCASHAVLTYDHTLRLLPDHLQQLDMESNGKSVDVSGDPVAWQTGPVIWGGEGTNGQHAFHQLLHQGTRLTSLDFIQPINPHHDRDEQHDWLVANCLSQSQALMQGRSLNEIKGSSELVTKHRVMPGNRPSNTLMIDQVTPFSVGALIALYEHKVFCQACIWNINPFDQWGVELGKQLSERIHEAIDTDKTGEFDPSTEFLLKHYQAKRQRRSH